MKVYMECATPQEWDSYTGYKTEGEPFGVCTFTGEAGDVYKGEFLNGKYDGLGNYTVDNYEMTGCYRNGDSHGAFEIEYSDNSIYEGGMYNKYEGFGVMKYPQTSEFEYFYGMWHDGKKEGEGVLICRNGDIYEGSWKDDKREGEFAVYQAGSEEGRKVTFKNDELAE